MSRSPVLQYLEKYSVAPSPSRDYYGIKVFGDQVTLYTWKISHGPHTHPVVRVARFQDFDKDRTMQDEIQRIFGDPMFRHVKVIVKGKGNSLLTLPENLLRKLSGYLGIFDVLNLCAVSRIANEIFSGGSVWEVLYKRQKMGLVYRDERERAASYGWKTLFKQRQMHRPAKDRKYNKRASGSRDLPSHRSNISTESSATSSLPLKKDKIITKKEESFSDNSNPKIKSITGSISSQNFVRNPENQRAKKSAKIAPRLDLSLGNSGVTKTLSNKELSRTGLDKKSLSGTQKDLSKKSSLISVNGDLGSMKLTSRTTASELCKHLAPTQNLPIGKGKWNAIFKKFPTPRKPVVNNGGEASTISTVPDETRKFYQFQSSVESNCSWKKSRSNESKLHGSGTTKSKSPNVFVGATETCDTLERRSTPVVSSVRGAPKKRMEIHCSKTKKIIK